MKCPMNSSRDNVLEWPSQSILASLEMLGLVGGTLPSRGRQESDYTGGILYLVMNENAACQTSGSSPQTV